MMTEVAREAPKTCLQTLIIMCQLVAATRAHSAMDLMWFCRQVRYACAYDIKFVVMPSVSSLVTRSPTGSRESL